MSESATLHLLYEFLLSGADTVRPGFGLSPSLSDFLAAMSATPEQPQQPPPQQSLIDGTPTNELLPIPLLPAPSTSTSYVGFSAQVQGTGNLLRTVTIFSAQVQGTGTGILLRRGTG